MANHVAIDVPPDAPGDFHAPGVASGIDVRLQDRLLDNGNRMPDLICSEIAGGRRSGIYCGHGCTPERRGWFCYGNAVAALREGCATSWTHAGEIALLRRGQDNLIALR